MIRTEHYVELLLGGQFYREVETRLVAARDPALVGPLPPRAFALRFFDVEVAGATRDDGRRVELRGEPANHSGVHYLGGRVLTLAEVEARTDGGFDLLGWHMRANDWARVVETRLGTFQPFAHGDVVLDAHVPRAA